MSYNMSKLIEKTLSYPSPSKINKAIFQIFGPDIQYVLSSKINPACNGLVVWRGSTVSGWFTYPTSGVSISENGFCCSGIFCLFFIKSSY